MEPSLIKDIQRGLQEKQANLNEWCESCSPAEKQSHLGPEDESKIQAHLHVIDTSLQELEEGSLGICEVCHDLVNPSLLQMDYTACVCLDHYSDEERRQLENELELSQIVQRAFIPQTVPSIPGFQVAAFSRPAQIVGGDYFDFLQFKDGALGFVVADVSGHGVSAGMLMTSLQTAFHTLVPESNSPVDVLERINRLYIHNIRFTTFVTIFFGRLDLDARKLTYASAGHNAAFLLRRSKKQELWLGPTGAAIGLLEEFKIQAREVLLEHEDVLLLYTDGITEATNLREEEFGQERLAGIIRQDAGLPAERLIQKTLQELNDFTEGRPLMDDTTLMVCKVE
jgi:sigma-B regulation protein RsbU (phosphoserine phosphatase)